MREKNNDVHVRSVSGALALDTEDPNFVTNVLPPNIHLLVLRSDLHVDSSQAA